MFMKKITIPVCNRRGQLLQIGLEPEGDVFMLDAEAIAKTGFHCQREKNLISL